MREGVECVLIVGRSVLVWWVGFEFEVGLWVGMREKLGRLVIVVEGV